MNLSTAKTEAAQARDLSAVAPDETGFQFTFLLRILICLGLQKPLCHDWVPFSCLLYWRTHGTKCPWAQCVEEGVEDVVGGHIVPELPREMLVGFGFYALPFKTLQITTKLSSFNIHRRGHVSIAYVDMCFGSQ